MPDKRPHNGDAYDRAPKRHHSSGQDSYRPSQSSRDRDYDRRDRDRHDRHRDSYDSSRRDGESRGSRDSRPKKEEMKESDIKRERHISHADAVNKLPAWASDTKPQVPSPQYTHGLSTHTDTDCPALPPIKEEYQKAVFTHKSLYTVSRELATNDVTYERLEFLGDAYLEIIASRIIYGHYPYLPAGRMSQLRELLVKNETLAEYSRSYGFDKKVRADMDLLKQDGKGRGNKGWVKILGDVMEAYVAAVVMSDFDSKGFETAEKWCTSLWAPKLLSAAGDDRVLTAMSLQGQAAAEADVVDVYDPEAKAKLQKRIMYGSDTRLTYETDKPTIELKGDKLGQNVHFIALYVDSGILGIKKKLLAKGEGKNKVEAGNWAAAKAMYGRERSFVEDLEKKIQAEKDRRALEKEKKMAVKAEVRTETEVEPDLKIEKVEW